MDFNVLTFIADNAGLDIYKALEKAHEQGVKDATEGEYQRGIKKGEENVLSWIKSKIPQSTDFYAVWTSILLHKLIDDYERERKREE